MKFYWGLSLIILYTSLGWSAEGVSVKVSEIEDRRAANVGQSDSHQPWWNNSLTLTLQIGGPTLRNAKQVGQLKITSATDDAGTTLKLKENPGVPSTDDKFKELSSVDSFNNARPDLNAFPAYEVKLAFTSPPRGAKSINIQGEFVIRSAGQIKEIVIPGISKLIGPIKQEDIAAAGLKFSVVDSKKMDQFLGRFFLQEGLKRLIALDIEGDSSLITKMSITDKGTEVASKTLGSESKGIKTNYFDGKNPLSDTAELRLTLLTNVTMVKVPLNLKKIQLP